MPNESVMAWIRARVDADAPMRKAAEQRTAEPTGPADDASPDVLMVLTRDHNEVHTLVQELSALPGHKSGGSPEDLSRRKSIVDMIADRVTRHEAAEEELFWPAVRKALPDGDAWADGALTQEQEGKGTLTALAGLEPDSDEFDSAVAHFVAQLRKHVAYEAQVFARMREAMPDADRQKLGRRLIAAKKKGTGRRRKQAGANDPA